MSSVESIYADLAKLTPQERQKQIEEGARKEGKLIIIHTLRGDEGPGHIALFKKRYPFVDVDATLDIGAQDAAERLLAEETVGRHLTDIIVTSVPDLAELLRRDYLAHYPTPADDLILPQYKKFIDPQNRWVSWFWTEQGISYNPNLVPADKVPKSWFDLCDPFFKACILRDARKTIPVRAQFDVRGGGDAKASAVRRRQSADHPARSFAAHRLMVAGDHMYPDQLSLLFTRNCRRSVWALHNSFCNADSSARPTIFTNQSQRPASLCIGVVRRLVALAGKPGVRRLAGRGQ